VIGLAVVDCLKWQWLPETNLWRKRTSPRAGSDLRKGHRPEGDVGEAKEQAHFFHHRRVKRLSPIPLCQLRPWLEVAAGASLFRCGDVMTSPDDSLSLILRRLDEIERKLDRMLEELRTPTAIGYSARRGNHPRKD
jgi:hypothetical protein